MHPMLNQLLRSLGESNILPLLLEMNQNHALLVVLEHSFSYFYYKEELSGKKSETTPMHLKKISGKGKGTN